MRLIRSTIYGLTTAYRNAPATLDAVAPAGLITAICGPNGAGKSTMLGASMLGVIDRKIPKLGGVQSTPLKALAQHRGAYVESLIDLGGILGQVTIRQTVDNSGERSESFVLGANGKPHPDLLTTSVAAFDAWARTNLPAYSVRLASTFIPQQGHGLIRMTPGDRKAVVLRALGAEKLERRSEAARKRATGAAERLGNATALLAAAREGCRSIADARALLATAVAQHASAVEAAAAAAAAVAMAERRAVLEGAAAAASARRATLEAARADAQRARDGAAAAAAALACAKDIDAHIVAAAAALAADERAAAAVVHDMARARADQDAAEARAAITVSRFEAELDNMEVQRRAAVAQHTGLMPRLANNRAIVADAVAIRAAATRLVQIDADVSSGRERIAVLHEQILSSQRLADDAAQAAAAAATRCRDADKRAALINGRQAHHAAVAGAVSALPAVSAEARNAAVSVEVMHRRLETLRTQAATAMGRRIEALRVGLSKIAEWQREQTDQEVIAGQTLEADDTAAAEADELPGLIGAAQQDHDDLVVTARAHAAKVREVESLAARADEVARDVAALADLTAERKAAIGEAARASVAEKNAAAATGAMMEHHGAAQAEVQAMLDERLAVYERARHAARLDTAEERIAELERAVASEQATIDRLSIAIGNLPAARDAATQADLETAWEASHAVLCAHEAADAARLTASAHAAELQRLKDERESLGDPEGQVVAAERAGAAIAAIDPQIARATEEVEEAESAIASIAALAVPLSWARAAHADAGAAQRDAAVALARGEDAVARAHADDERVRAMDAQRHDAAIELARWTVLANDLGRNGLQADLCDAVTPELTETCRDLLRASLGTRWTVTFEASRENGDGAMVEGFTIRVLDNQTGREDDAADWCGGETALIGNAIADTVSVVACRRAEIESPTIVRDESSAALDPSNERAWISMLRRTAAITGASRLFVVTHSPAVRALCDSVIEFGNGTIALVS